jgi:hypothetical protein
VVELDNRGQSTVKTNPRRRAKTSDLASSPT